MRPERAHKRRKKMGWFEMWWMMKRKRNVALAIFAVVFVVVFLVASRAFGDVVLCGSDVPAVNTESDHARKFGLDPDCYGRGIEFGVVIPGDSKRRLEAARTDIGLHQRILVERGFLLAETEDRLFNLEKDLAEFGKKLEKAMRALKPAAIPAVKSATAKKGKVAAPAVKYVGGVIRTSEEVAWALVLLLALGLFLYFLNQYQKKKRLLAQPGPQLAKPPTAQKVTQEVPPVVETEIVAPSEEKEATEPEKQA